MGGRGERQVKELIRTQSRVRESVNEYMQNRIPVGMSTALMRQGSKVKADWIKGGIGDSCDAAFNQLILLRSDFDFDLQNMMTKNWQHLFQR